MYVCGRVARSFPEAGVAQGRQHQHHHHHQHRHHLYHQHHWVGLSRKLALPKVILLVSKDETVCWNVFAKRSQIVTECDLMSTLTISSMCGTCRTPNKSIE